MDPLDFHHEIEKLALKNEVLCPKGQLRRICGKASRTGRNGLVLGSHGGDAGNSTSMSSGSGDGEAK